jgi:hypothetical protein
LKKQESALPGVSRTLKALLVIYHRLHCTCLNSLPRIACDADEERGNLFRWIVVFAADTTSSAVAEKLKRETSVRNKEVLDFGMPAAR